ncbi:MAG TPA: hypothetical protein VFW55_07850 [Propionicimonas sp.]|nr:hypothetical protein [Propionicimonas sp.]
MGFKDSRLREWWAAAFPDTDVIDQGLKASRDYDAYVILDRLPQGGVAAVIGYNPRLNLAEQEQAALECKRRVDSFAERGRNGPYVWQERASDGGYQSWIRHRSPVGTTIWPRLVASGTDL